MPPKVSINLCCYNSAQYLEETLESVVSQTYKDWELVIVNDGSTDDTESIVRRYINQGLPIIYHYQTNAGLGNARNRAIELSTGEFIALIDHDDVWLPQKLERQIPLFQGGQRVGVVYCDAQALLPDGRLKPRKMDMPMQRGQVFSSLILSDFILCSSIVIRRSVLDKAGVFNPNFVQVEEYDLLIRIAEHYEFDYVDEPLVKYRFHPRNASWDGSRMQRETIAMMHSVLGRRPNLTGELGRNVARLRSVGLRCTPAQACLLRGQFRQSLQHYDGRIARLLRDLPRTIVSYLLAQLHQEVVIRLVGVWRSLTKRRILS